MFSVKQIWLTALFVCFLSGCSTGEPSSPALQNELSPTPTNTPQFADPYQISEENLTFERFRQRVSEIAGVQSIDCGHLQLGGEFAEIKECVTTNFEQAQPFWVTYDLLGIDSYVATAIVLNREEQTIIFHFDSDPAGGGRVNTGRVLYEFCKGAALVEETDPYDIAFIECSS